MKSRFDFNSVSEITGAFVILTAVILGVLLTMTARVQRWFEPVYRIEIELPPPEDLSAGAEVLSDSSVLIAASTVGKVAEVHVDEESQQGYAILQIQGKLVRELTSSATAHISMPILPFLGEATIKLSKGRGASPLFSEDQRETKLTSAATMEVDLQKRLAGWDEAAKSWNEIAHKWERNVEEWNGRMIKWEGYFDEWNQIAHEWERRFAKTYDRIDRELEEPDGKLYLLLDNAQKLTGHLAEEGLLQWATRDPDWNRRTKELLDSVQRGTEEAGEILALIDALASGERPLPPPFDETVAQLPLIAERVGDLLERVEGVVAQVELASMSFPVIAGSIEQDVRTIPGFLIESQETLRQIEIMVRALQRHWLLRSYVDQRPAEGRIPVEEVIVPSGGER